MTPAREPDFDEWVNYVFTEGMRDFHESGADQHYYALLTDHMIELDFADYEYSEIRRHIPVTVLADYFERLLNKPEFLIESFSYKQLEDGLRVLFGLAGNYIPGVRLPPVPEDQQVRLLRAMVPFYVRFIDGLAWDRANRSPEQEKSISSLATTIYMIWDMVGFGLTEEDRKLLILPAWHFELGLFPTESAEKAAIGFDVLRTILARGTSMIGQHSVLHALGHLVPIFPERAFEIIDEFLLRSDIHESVRDTALEARTGKIM